MAFRNRCEFIGYITQPNKDEDVIRVFNRDEMNVPIGASFNIFLNEYLRTNKVTNEPEYSGLFQEVTVFNKFFIEDLLDKAERGSCIYVCGTLRDTSYVSKDGSKVSRKTLIVRQESNGDACCLLQKNDIRAARNAKNRSNNVNNNIKSSGLKVSSITDEKDESFDHIPV